MSESDVNLNENGAVEREGINLHRANEQQARNTRLARHHSTGDSSLSGEVVHKVCCQCGVELNHRPRFKDSTGRYWCPHCNDQDHMQHQPAQCAECKVEMMRSDLQDLFGVLLCPVCYDRRRLGTDVKVVEPVLNPPTTTPQQPSRLWIWVGLIIVMVLAIVVYWISTN